MANSPIFFNTDGMRAIANQITNNANQALSDHAVAWNHMQGHIASYPSNLQGLLYEIVNSHQQRLSQTYHWQLSYASALTDSANLADEAEAEITSMFS